MTYSDINWCISNWKDFVTLTEKERIVFEMLKAGCSEEDIKQRLESRESYKKKKRKPKTKYKIKVVETGVIYNSLSECAEAFDTDRQQVYNALKLNYKLKKKYSLEKIA
jgi:hypothetical protein